MTLTYEPDDTVVHGLDARAKLAVQVGFSVAAFAAPSLRWLAGLTVFTAVVLLLARVSPFRAVRRPPPSATRPVRQPPGHPRRRYVHTPT